MKNSFFTSKVFFVIMLILLGLSLTYLSSEEKYEVKEVTKEIKLDIHSK